MKQEDPAGPRSSRRGGAGKDHPSLWAAWVAGTFLRRILPPLLLLLLLREISPAATIDRVVATIGNEVVTLSDYQRFVARLNTAHDPEKVEERLLKALLEEKIIVLDAVRNGIDAPEPEVDQRIREFLDQSRMRKEDLEKQLAEDGLSMKEYRTLVKENIIAMKFIEREVNAKIVVSNGEIAEYYRNNRGLFLVRPERVTVKAILLRVNAPPSVTEITDLKIKGLRIVSEIRRGEAFEKMVALHSDKSVRDRDGLLGEFEKGTLVPALDRKISAMREGDVSDPVWTHEGVYIIKLVGRSPESYLPIEQVRDQIYGKIYERKREEVFNAWMKALWERSSVKIRE